MPGNILKHLFQSKSVQPLFVNAYDFDTMIVETDDESKLEELRKNKDKSFTVNTSKHIRTGYTLVIYYLEDMKMYIFVMLVRIVWIFLLKRFMKT